MKYVAWVLVITLLAVVIGGVYLYLNANVTIENITFASVTADNRLTEFDQYKRRLDSGTANGTIFTSEPLSSNPRDYAFYIYTVQLKNACFIPAKMVEVQITPVEGDILQLGSNASRTVNARSFASLDATVLTTSTNHSVRQITVSYYLWGYVFKVTKTYG